MELTHPGRRYWTDASVTKAGLAAWYPRAAPLTPKARWDAAKAFAEGLAGRMPAYAPGRFAAWIARQERNGRIFVDWLRDVREATAVAAVALPASAARRFRDLSVGLDALRRPLPTTRAR